MNKRKKAAAALLAALLVLCALPLPAAADDAGLSGWTDEEIRDRAAELFQTPDSSGYTEWLTGLSQDDRDRVIALTGAGRQLAGADPAGTAAEGEPALAAAAVRNDRAGDAQWAWTGSVNGTTPYYSYALAGLGTGWSTSWLALTRTDGFSEQTICIDPPASDPHYSGTFTAFTNSLGAAGHTDLFTEQVLLIWWFSNAAQPGFAWRNAVYGAVQPGLSAEAALVWQHILISYLYDPASDWNHGTSLTAESLEPILSRVRAMAEQLQESGTFSFTDDAGAVRTFEAEPVYSHDAAGNQTIQNQVHWFIPGAGGTGNGQRNLFATPVFHEREPEPENHIGYVRVVKTSAETAVAGSNNTCYSLGGAVYGVYSDAACTALLGRLTTNADGRSEALEIDMGASTSMTVYVKEISAPGAYWRLDPAAHAVTVSSEANASPDAAAEASSAETPVVGYLRVRKSSSMPEITDGNRMYPLAGIRFRVYADQDCGQPAVDAAGSAFTLTADENGLTETVMMAPGTYWVREEVSSAGNWRPNGDPVRVTVGADSTEAAPAETTVVNAPALCPIGLLLTKVDAETGESSPQGTASLVGAQFTVCYYDGTSASGTPVRTWVFGTDADGAVRMDAAHLVSGDDLFSDAGGSGSTDSQAVLPVGTVTVRETRAPEGYVLNDSVRTVHITMQADGTAAPDVPFTRQGDTADLQILHEEQIIRADLAFSKTDIDGNPMAGIPFRIDLLDGEGNVIESQEAVTDENGGFDTSSGNTGVWFGGPSAQRSAAGALIFGRYRVTELPCAANAGHDLLTQEFSVTEPGRVYRLTAGFIDLVIHPESDLIDDATGSRTVTLAEEASFTDTFRYDHLKTTKTYILETEIVWLSGDGSERQTLGSGRVTFTPEAQDATQTAGGTVRNTVTVRTAGLDGGTIHAVDRLYLADGDAETLLVTHNEDLSEERQTLRVPWIGTAASDPVTGGHTGVLSEEASVTDVVEYRGLADGGMYVLEGTLRDAETGEPVTGADGEPCVVTKVLRINARLTEMTDRGGTAVGPRDGEVTMPAFEFDASAYAGRTLVVTEVLSDHDTGAVILEHADLSDEGQSVHFPAIATEASAADTNDHITGNSAEAVITDVVSYENLLTDGRTYTVRGYLTDRETGSALLIDGARVEAETVFTPEETSGSVTLTFSFDASALAGTALVAFEEILYHDAVIAVHADIDDEAQTVYLPRIATQAADRRSGTQEMTLGTRSVLTDEIAYEGLMPGREYTVRGTIMDRETGEPLTQDGEPVTAEASFTPETPDGTVEMRFRIDTTDLHGRELVVFERIFTTAEAGADAEPGTAGTDGEILVAWHEDLNAASQTVSVPERPPAVPAVPTGDRARPVLLTAMCAGAGTCCLAVRKKRRKETAKEV